MIRALGMMSGTSLDGVDAAMIETDGERIAAFGDSAFRAFSDNEAAVLHAALTDGQRAPLRPRKLGEAIHLLVVAPRTNHRKLALELELTQQPTQLGIQLVIVRRCGGGASTSRGPPHRRV